MYIWNKPLYEISTSPCIISRIRINADVHFSYQLFHNDALIPQDSVTENYYDVIIDSLNPGWHRIEIYLYKENIYNTHDTYYFCLYEDTEHDIHIYNPEFLSNTGNEILDNREKTRLLVDFGLSASNSKLKKENSDVLTEINGKILVGACYDLNKHFATGFLLGGSFGYSPFQKSQYSYSSNTYQHRISTDFNSGLFLRFQIPRKKIDYEFLDAFALQFGLNYQIPLIIREVSYINLNDRRIERFFSRYNDFSFNANFYFYGFGLGVEYHPLDLFWGNYHELSKLRLGIKYHFLNNL